MSQRTARLAIAILTLCCVWWGFSFPAMQIGAASVDRVVLGKGPSDRPMRTRLAIRGTYNGWRFGVAGLICLAFAGAGGGRFGRREVVGGLLVGFFFGAGMLLQICGLQYTLPSVSSFLTALSVVFTPLAQAVVFRKAVGGRVWLAVVLAAIGMIVLSRGNPDASASNTMALAPPVPYLGQVMTVLGAMFFTAQILSVDHFGQRADPSKLTAVMLLTCGVLNFLIGSIMGGQLLNRVEVIAALGRDFTFLWTFAGLVVLSSILTMQLMNTWQPRISPATAAVVYCMEPLFGTLFSVAFRTERLTMITLAGGFLILIAVLTIVRRPEEVHID